MGPIKIQNGRIYAQAQDYNSVSVKIQLNYKNVLIGQFLKGK